MNKRQYIFLGLVFLLLSLSYKIIQFEYKKYQIANYMNEQQMVINKLKNYLDETKETLKYINTKAFKNKVLKGENSMKMKGEEVIILTSEKIYKKFSQKNILDNKKEEIPNKIESITSGMTNFQKWMYFLFKN